MISSESTMTYAEALNPRVLRFEAMHIWEVAFPGELYPKKLKVHVAAGFYLPDTPKVLADLAPMVLCPPSNREGFVRTLAHEFCHHRIGYIKPAHGPRFRAMHDRALRNLKQARILNDTQ